MSDHASSRHFYASIRTLYAAKLSGGCAVGNGSSSKVDVTIEVHLAVACHLLAPRTHVLHKRIDLSLVGSVDGFLVFAYLPNLSAGQDIRQPEVVHINFLLDGPLYQPGEYVLAQTWFLADRAGEANAINGVQRRDHGTNGLDKVVSRGLEQFVKFHIP